MATAKKEAAIVLERTYNVPLRKEYQKAPRWKRTEKAVVALRQFLARHMKSEIVLLSPALNEQLWLHGIKNPPHHVKVTVTKNEKGEVNADLFGVKKAEPKEAKTKKKQAAAKKEATPKAEKKAEAKVE